MSLVCWQLEVQVDWTKVEAGSSAVSSVSILTSDDGRSLNLCHCSAPLLKTAGRMIEFPCSFRFQVSLHQTSLATSENG